MGTAALHTSHDSNQDPHNSLQPSDSKAALKDNGLNRKVFFAKAGRNTLRPSRQWLADTAASTETKTKRVEITNLARLHASTARRHVKLPNNGC